MDSVEDVARVLDANRRLGMGSGIVLAVPISPEHAADGEVIERAIQVALEEADEKNIRARDTTPFLLRRVNELTGGASLRANIQLVLNNAKIGAQVSAAYAELQARERPFTSFAEAAQPLSIKDHSACAVVIGGVVMDTVGMTPCDQPEFTIGSSNIGQVTQSLGGVGKNIAECSGRVGVSTLLISAVGSDLSGDAIISMARASGMRVDGISKVPNERSASYVAVHGKGGDLVGGIADMEIFDKLSWPTTYAQNKRDLDAANIIACDSNVPTTFLAEIAGFCARHAKPLWVEPTSNAKCCRSIEAGILPHITFMSPNSTELATLASAISGDPFTAVHLDNVDSPTIIDLLRPQVRILLNEGVKTVIVSLGSHGLVVGTQSSTEAIDSAHLIHVESDPISPVKVSAFNLLCARCVQSQFFLFPSSRIAMGPGTRSWVLRLQF